MENVLVLKNETCSEVKKCSSQPHLYPYDTKYDVTELKHGQETGTDTKTKLTADFAWE